MKKLLLLALLLCLLAACAAEPATPQLVVVTPSNAATASPAPSPAPPPEAAEAILFQGGPARDALYGLLSPQGEVLVEPRYHSAWLGTPPGVPARFVMSLGIPNDEGDVRYALDVYDGQGNLVFSHDEQYYLSSLDGGFLLRQNVGEDGAEPATMDVLSWDGAWIASIPHTYYLPVRYKDGYVLRVDDESLIHLDADWNVTRTLPYLPIYEEAPDLGSQLFPFEEDGLWGFMDIEGNVAIEPRFTGGQGIDSPRYLLAGEDATYYRLIDHRGDPVTEDLYTRAMAIAGGAFYEVWLSDTQCQLLDENLRPLTPPDEPIAWVGYDYDMEQHLTPEAYYVWIEEPEAEGAARTLFFRDGSSKALPAGWEISSARGNLLLLQRGEYDTVMNNYFEFALYDVTTDELSPFSGKYNHMQFDSYEEGPGYVIATIYEPEKHNIFHRLYDPVRDQVLIERSLDMPHLSAQGILISREVYGRRVYGLLDHDGNELLPLEYLRLIPLPDNPGYYAAQRGDTYGVIDGTGRWIYQQPAYVGLED